MTADLTVRLHDPARVETPREWADYHARDSGHPLWSWPTVRALPGAFGDPVIAATLHDGDTVVGVAVGRVRGPGARRRHPLLTVADLSCPGTSAQPGIRLLGCTPGVAMARQDIDRYAAAVDALERALRADWPARIDLVGHRQTFAEVLPVVQRGVSLAYAGAPSAMLRRGFDSWDDYLSTLRPSRRSSVRRIVKRLDADPDVESREGVGGFDGAGFDEALELMRATADRYASRRFPPPGYWPAALLRALFAQPAARTLHHRRVSDGRLLACGVLFDHPDVPTHGHWGALDRDAGAPSGLWVYHLARTLRGHIEAGASGAVGGKGLTDLKAEFGFEAVPQWTVLRRLAPAKSHHLVAGAADVG